MPVHRLPRASGNRHDHCFNAGRGAGHPICVWQPVIGLAHLPAGGVKYVDRQMNQNNNFPVRKISKQFVALLLVLWLPLSGAGALAASLSMQMHDACHEVAMTAMQHQHADDHQAAEHHGHNAQCSECGVCHLAGSGYLATPVQELVTLQIAGKLITPYQVSFKSVTTAPLDPPPLARS